MNMKIYVRKIIEENGGLAAIHAGSKDFEQRAKLINTIHDDLVKKYSNQWVTLLRGGKMCVGDTLTELMSEIDENGLDRTSTFIKYMATDPPLMIL